MKTLGLLLLLLAAFGLGYYTGQRPIGELTKSVSDLSRKVVNSTLGLERNLRLRQGLVDAKSRIIQAKSEVLDRNYGNAAKELTQVVTDLEKASEATDDTHQAALIKALVQKVHEAHKELGAGRPIAKTRLHEFQHALDQIDQSDPSSRRDS